MPPPSANNGLGYLGFQPPNTWGSDFNADVFLIWSILARISTATLVKVVAVSNDDEVAPVGTVDVLPLVNQVDGANNAVEHSVVYGLPYFRLQGGVNAIIIDPKVDDIGIVIFADRDISAVKDTKDQANPGSKRRFDMADGLYIGGVLNGVPVQYIRYMDTGIEIKSPLVTMTGNLRVNGSIIAGYGTGDQVGVQTHTHTQGNDGHGDSEQPTNAPTAGT